MSDRPLRLVVLGLSLSSAWGNGHATTYRALLKAFAARGHRVLFLERDVPWYASQRDLASPDYCELVLYRDLDDLRRWQDDIAAADAVVLGSYVPQGVAVGDLVQRIARGATAFYDIDTPVTLAKLARDDEEYIAARQVPQFDLYLSFTGGPTLRRLEREYGAPAARVLHCSVDPAVYQPLGGPRRWDLSYLGTYSDDRQPMLEALLLEPARRAPQLRFVVAGAQYPAGIDWPANVERLEHVAPADHPAFYTASRFTLNVTRQDMVQAGHSPSVRLFEAGACGTPVISDTWDGIEALFRPGEEILLATRPGQVLDILLGTAEPARDRLAAAFRQRVLGAHTAAHRAAELEGHLRAALRRHDHLAREQAAT
ncbi:CgeB family protein [Paracraurococcus lichenis]|uniref:Glycosyltransferase n=1 Tax=Paracraurococcus lichenis TaxID=3064888 RepID=A0ABT9E8P2_9PROT|nr:glycosyltransferase [Paracraurococcus sp. LOR1-02]MDO9712343.1 glycosyltransferase [Paracraurococcus sp. LOR1-02]